MALKDFSTISPMRPTKKVTPSLLRPENTTVLENLQREHEAILGKLDDAIAASGDDRDRIFAQLKLELRKHMEAEEADFYPVVADLSDDADTAVTTALSQHTTIKSNLTTLESSLTTPNLNTLKTNLVAHIKSERAILFDYARKGLTHNQLNVIADDVTTTENASVLT